MNSGKLDRYVPRGVLEWLAGEPAASWNRVDGTMVFVDVSGFTRLSERLARFGREGAEYLTDAIDTCFSALLADAYVAGGSLLKFGGDALLVWFDGPGHPERGCAAAVAMRRRMREVGRIRAGSSEVVLRMSVGVHSGEYDTFLVGDSHREYMITGPAATMVVAMEAVADAGQIVISPGTADRIPQHCVGAAAASSGGHLLKRAPQVRIPNPEAGPFRPDDALIAGCLSTDVRAHVLGDNELPEHRDATVAFIQFGDADALIEHRGGAPAGAALHELVATAQEAADRHDVCLLGSDVAADGGKLILTAGAPRAIGDDEHRMVLALRQIVDSKPELLVRAGVNRGHLFAGEIGPQYRRTYTVMGDAVNLAARLMAKAPWGRIYASLAVAERCRERFELADVEPFMVKGKTLPVTAFVVGRVRRERQPRPRAAATAMPLIGRTTEVAALRSAIERAQAGDGGMMIELVGDTGSGRSRLLAEARALGDDMRFVHTTGESYTQTTPYSGWRDPLRQLIGVGWDDPNETVVERLVEAVIASQPALLRWLPLLAIAIDATVPSTPDVEQLAPDVRAAKLREAVLEFLEPALSTPTLVQVEHAHLLDEASAALLHALAPALADSRWVVIVTRREVETGFTAPAAAALTFELGPLGAADATALAEASPYAASVPPHVLALAVERSGGSPEFLLDLLAAAAATRGETPLPDSVGAAALARLDGLAPRDRMLVRRASVLGVSFHPRRLVHVLESGAAEPGSEAWERLCGIFALDPDGHVRFKRPALREVAYAGLPFKLRRELHGALAEALERDVGADVDADLAVLSLHYLLANNPEKACEYALRAAERAHAQFAHADAARLYRRAIEAGRGDEAMRVHLAEWWERLADALRSTGQPAEATAALTSARKLTDDPVVRARLMHAHAEVTARSDGGLLNAIRWARRGLRLLQDVDGSEATSNRARLLALLAGIRQRQGLRDEAAELCERAIADAEKSGELRALARACFVLDWARVDQGRGAEAVHSERALEIYRDLGDLEQESAVLNNLGMFAYWDGRWDDAVELYRRAGECSARAGRAADLAYTDCNIGEILSDQGRFEQAVDHLERARRLFSSTGEEITEAFVDGLLGRLDARRGRYSDAIERLEHAEARLRRMQMLRHADQLVALVAEAEALGGDPERALALAQARIAALDDQLPLLHRARAIALLRLRKLDDMNAALSASLAAARELGSSYEIAATLDVWQQLDPDRDDDRDEWSRLIGELQIERLPELDTAGLALTA